MSGSAAIDKPHTKRHKPQEATLSGKGAPQPQQNCGHQQQMLKHANAPQPHAHTQHVNITNSE